ncbi:MAG: hypothetical protein Q8865_04945 [Bacillota bacterium]|nr:hypothetical protein [Bacillota bacterium]
MVAEKKETVFTRVMSHSFKVCGSKIMLSLILLSFLFTLVTYLIGIFADNVLASETFLKNMLKFIFNALEYVASFIIPVAAAIAADRLDEGAQIGSRELLHKVSERFWRSVKNLLMFSLFVLATVLVPIILGELFHGIFGMLIFWLAILVMFFDLFIFMYFPATIALDNIELSPFWKSSIVVLDNPGISLAFAVLLGALSSVVALIPLIHFGIGSSIVSDIIKKSIGFIYTSFISTFSVCVTTLLYKRIKSY